MELRALASMELKADDVRPLSSSTLKNLADAKYTASQVTGLGPITLTQLASEHLH